MARTIASRRQKASAGGFVGRFAEQQLFRATLRQLAALRDRHDEQLTDDELSYAQIFLWAREDPDFVFIRDDPRYRALVGLDGDDAHDG